MACMNYVLCMCISRLRSMTWRYGYIEISAQCYRLSLSVFIVELMVFDIMLASRNILRLSIYDAERC